MPGGFARVSDKSDARAVSMTGGVESADVWVLADSPVETTSLLPTPERGRIVRMLGGLKNAPPIVRAGDELPPFDLACPLMSLPAIRGTTEATIPATIPYLFAEPDAVESGAATRDVMGFEDRLGTW